MAKRIYMLALRGLLLPVIIALAVPVALLLTITALALWLATGSVHVNVRFTPGVWS